MDDESVVEASGNVADSASELFGELYEHLHELAGRYMRRQGAGHTLQPTALVSEAYLKLYKKSPDDWSSPQHFMAAAARTMLSVLVDHARTRGRRKRTAPGSRVPLDAALVHFQRQAVDIIDLQEKLEEFAGLGVHEERGARIVELRAFGGFSMAEIAAYLRTPKRTIERDFQVARAWLHQQLRGREKDADAARSESRAG